MSQYTVSRGVRRPEPHQVARLGAFGASTVHESQGRTGYVGTTIRPIQTGVRLAGTAVTVAAQAGDNMIVHVAVECCRPGDVLVVTHASPSEHGILGELMATSLQARGVVGFVTDAGVRDVAELRAMGFPVWSHHVACQGTSKSQPGSVNVPVQLGAARVHPGDVIVADDDGVVVVAIDAIDGVLDAAEARVEREAATRDRLANGELGLDIYGLRPGVEASGIRYSDET